MTNVGLPDNLPPDSFTATWLRFNNAFDYFVRLVLLEIELALEGII